MIMRYEWDERKRLSNLEKHGLDFFDVGIVFESPHIEVPSSHGSEKRLLAIGTLEGRFVTVVYTMRNEAIRVISLGGHIMKKETHIKSYTAGELKAKRKVSSTDLKKVDAMTDAKLEKVIAEDEDERDLQPDWTKAKLILSEPKQSVHLRLEQETIDFFKTRGKGHISRMQAVLKAYVTAHRSR